MSIPHDIFEILSFMQISIPCHPESNVGANNYNANSEKTEKLEMKMDWCKVVCDLFTK